MHMTPGDARSGHAAAAIERHRAGIGTFAGTGVQRYWCDRAAADLRLCRFSATHPHAGLPGIGPASPGATHRRIAAADAAACTS